ncbi:MAG: hypothetical protein JHD28_09765, partial [Bacteroidia bacterium]|nr:hypothetical protein [Bacteroidia bacterium]
MSDQVIEIKENYVDSLYKRIRVLNELAWEGKLSENTLKKWLENFNGSALGVDKIELEQLCALQLISQLMFFGAKEIRVLLKALYNECFLCQLIKEINCTPNDISTLYNKLHTEVKYSKFLGVGNPSESGVHLLYYFRQENSLPK